MKNLIVLFGRAREATNPMRNIDCDVRWGGDPTFYSNSSGSLSMDADETKLGIFHPWHDIVTESGFGYFRSMADRTGSLGVYPHLRIKRCINSSASTSSLANPFHENLLQNFVLFKYFLSRSNRTAIFKDITSETSSSFGI